MTRENSNEGSKEMINDKNSAIGTAGQSRVSEEDFEKARMLAEEIGFSKDSGIELLELEEGYCKGRIVIRKRHLNPLNTVHGGVFFTLADTICGIAAASTGHGGPTVQGDMDYMPDISDLKVKKTDDSFHRCRSPELRSEVFSRG